MKLQPFDPAQEALKLAGIGEKSLATKTPEERINFSSQLDNFGASLEDVARGLGNVFRNGEPAEIIRASQLVLQAKGILKEAEKPTIPAIHINIHGKEERNLLQLITPNIHSSEIGAEA